MFDDTEVYGTSVVPQERSEGMADGILLPDEPLDFPKRPRRVVMRLADTAVVRRARHPDPPPCYAPCEACGQLVLTGRTSTGTRLALDTQIATYLVDWDHGAPAPRLLASRGYPVHRCPFATERH